MPKTKTYRCPWCTGTVLIDDATNTTGHDSPACVGYMRFCGNRPPDKFLVVENGVTRHATAEELKPVLN